MMEINELFEIIHKSTKEANEKFSKWTGGWWLQAYGVEGFLVAQIAEAIMNSPNKPGFLTLETPFVELYESSGVKPRGNKGYHGKDKNRVDIALYHKNETLSHVIEVKRSWSPACIDDLKRLCTLYKKCGKIKGGTLKGAIFVQLLDVGIKKYGIDNVDKHFQDLEKKCSDCVEDPELQIKASRGTDFYDPIKTPDETEAFSSFCLGISGSKLNAD
jgi:hypothetical protein